jgi:serine O-acetyltransferase
MEINKWINSSLPEIVNQLEENILSGFHIQTEEGLNLSGRNAIYELLDDLLAVLFPGAYSKEKVSLNELNFFIGDTLRHITFKLKKRVEEVLEYHCINKDEQDDCEECDCEEKALDICRKVIESLPELRKVLLTDIKAAREGDPAAKSLDEVVLSYPYIEAVATYRIAHLLYEHEVPIIPRIMTERAHSNTGIDIHPGAKIGPNFFIDHGTGVVIGETSIIGRNVKIYQGVTLGAVSPFDRDGTPRRDQKRHPTIEDDVIIYSNATILGGGTVIGKGAIIGGNTWITSPVAPGEVVYSNNKKK